MTAAGQIQFLQTALAVSLAVNGLALGVALAALCIAHRELRAAATLDRKTFGDGSVRAPIFTRPPSRQQRAAPFTLAGVGAALAVATAVGFAVIWGMS